MHDLNFFNQLSSYQFNLPEELIAQYPLPKRDDSRLLVVRRAQGKIEHRLFKDLPDLLDPETLCVANNTRVMKARLLGRRLISGLDQKSESLGGKTEFLMLEQKGPLLWEGLFHSAAKQQPGLQFQVEGQNLSGQSSSPVRGKIIKKLQGTVLVEFNQDPLTAEVGHIPLPHYITRGKKSHSRDVDEPLDAEKYQTVYSKVTGSAAAPTAGLHFTPEVLARLNLRNCSWIEVTLHVGIGTFRPVKVENLNDHTMHREFFQVSDPSAQAICLARAQQKKILAIGTTSARTLESAAQACLGGHGEQGYTEIFIKPGYAFKVVDQMLTNFHLPGSTLMMMVCALGGYDLIMHAYQEAIKEKYRFYSYGDAMLVL